MHCPFKSHSAPVAMGHNSDSSGASSPQPSPSLARRKRSPRLTRALALSVVLGAIPCMLAADDMSTTNDDPYLWLENVGGDKALDWVRQQNAVSTGKLEASPGFAKLRERLLAILDSHERIP